jgi:hypothetical protein
MTSDPALSLLLSGEAVPLEFDTTDPLAVVVAWLLTAAVRFAAKKRPDSELLESIRHALPLIAVLIAIFFRAAVATYEGGEVNTSTVLRGIAAGSVAVFLHSQGRELKKQKESAGAES